MSDCCLAHGGSTLAALNSSVDTLEIAGRTALANFLTIKCSSADCSLIPCAFNTSDADPTVLCSTSWQSSEWTSPTERQLSLLHNWLSWRDMHCMLNSTYTSSLVTTEVMGSITVFDSKLFLTVKFEKVYFSFQAFGIFDYKDSSTSTSTLCFYTSEQPPHRHLQGSAFIWTECLVTDSTVYAVSAYFWEPTTVPLSELRSISGLVLSR